MDKHNLSFPVSFEKVSEFENNDTRFTKLKCWLMHTGQNYNGSEFSKEVIQNAIPTLSYIPVVGFIENNDLGEKDFSDHRYIITKDDGQVRRKYMGSAYGVLLSSEENNAHFEMKMCDDGKEREFIVADAIMWNFLEDSSSIINRDLVKDHSIELDENSIEGYEDESGIFHFTNFSFRAACVLGCNAQPAMEGSCVEVQFTMSDFVKDIQRELNDKYTAFTKLVNVENEGGNKTMAENANKSNKDFALSVMQQFENVANIVREHETYTDRWGDEMARYCLVDIQDNEVIVVDRQSNYQYYGFTFTVDGDAPNIDFSSGCRKKISYTNYEEGTSVPEGAFDFGKEIEDIETKAFSKVETANKEVSDAKEAQEQAESNYSQIKTEYDAIKPKYDNYVHEEQVRQENEINSQKDAEFSRFEEVLGENEDFIALKEKKADMSVEDITAQCSILYTRITLANKANFSKPNNTRLTVGVMEDIEDEKEGFVATKYGNIPVKR